MNNLKGKSMDSMVVICMLTSLLLFNPLSVLQVERR